MGARKFIRSLYRRFLFSSDDHRYHFIHIPKNGGQSVRYALELYRDVSLSRPFHYRYVDIADSVGRDLKYFCIVRNPWARTASRYMFGIQNAQIWPDGDPRKEYIANATFEQYVKDQRILPIPEHPDQPWMGPLSSWFNQLDWIRDEDGRVACDCMRLERLSDDLSLYLDRQIEIPRKNVTNQRYSYRDLYTDELIQLVADLFAEDIEHFGFDFEGGATRNVFALEYTRPAEG